MHADDVFLRDRRDIGELLLHVAERRMSDVAVAVREHDEERRDREGDQRQLPVEEEEDGGDRQNRQDVLEEEDKSVAEEEPDALQVDGRARHQLPGLMPVVEPERQTHEV